MRLNKRGYYDVLLRTCAKSSSSIAVRHYDNGSYVNYTYSELFGVCEYISQKLQQLQCSKGVIGLISKQNIIIPSVIAAAHKCCTTFMFLDPHRSIEAYDIKFTVIIIIKDKINKTGSELIHKKPDHSVAVFDLIIEFYNYESPSQNSRHVAHHSFIATTSGSTGEPKHIQVPIQCLQPNIDDLTKLFDITSEDIIYFSTPLTFDPSMIEILLACINGASLLIAPDRADILFPENQENSVTFWQTTPSRFFQHSDADLKNKILSANSTLKTLALGGEPLNGVKRLKELKDCNNKTRIFTLYGVTEMSCWACAAELDLHTILNDREVPLGNCLSETQLILEPQNNNTFSKILLASKTRKCNILNNSNVNDVENSVQTIDSGDLGEMRNGNVYYRGRKDDIIKRFGNKINLQLIESVIMQCPRVKTCSSVWLPKPMLLVVYFSSETLSSQELSDFLKCKLNDKHWPDKIVRVDNLPTNSHGKISKQFISNMFEKVIASTQTEHSLKLSFLKELKIMISSKFTYDQVKDKDFFSIGGTSFLAVALCNKLSLSYPQFGKIILPHLIAQNKTIDEIMQLAQMKLCTAESKPKRQLKRLKSSTENNKDSVSVKKSNTEIADQDFIILWSYDTGKCVDASPVLYQTGFQLYVAVGSHSGKIIVMDAISGILQGMLTLKSRVEASVLICHEEAMTSPCGVVGSYDGTVVCFRLLDCQQIWTTNIGCMIKSKAACCKGSLYVASYDGNVRCIDIMSGKVKAIIQVAVQPISADLILAKSSYVLVGTLSGACASIYTETNTVAWQDTLGSPIFASPVLYDSDKYVIFIEVNGQIHCRTVEKGIKIWKYQGANGNIFSSIYITEIGKLKWRMVFGCHDNNVYNIKINNFQPSLHWKTELSSPIYSTPCALSDQWIVAAANNGMLCIIDSETGVILSEYQLPDETFSSPVVYGDYLFIGCRNDHLYSLRCTRNI